MPISWTQRFKSATLLWEKTFRGENLSRHDGSRSRRAARRFAGDLLLVADCEEARQQMKRDLDGACAFAAYLHEAADRIASGELPEPPTLSAEHMPFYLPVCAVNDLLRHRAMLRLRYWGQIDESTGEP
jgi:hypothetical protein